MKTVNIDSRQAVGKAHRPRLLSYYLGHALIYVGFLIIGLILGWLLLKANRIYTSYGQIIQQVPILESNRADLNLPQARTSLRTIATEVETISDELAPLLPLAPYLGWIPTYGGDIQASPDLLALGRDLSRAGLVLDQAIPPLFEPDGGNSEQGSPVPLIVNSLAASNSELVEVEALLRRDQAQIDDLDAKQLSPEVARRVEQIKVFLPEVITGLQLARELPALLGADTPKTYLVLTQSLDELRPTGGYINAAGHVTVDQGEIVEFEMQDSYAVDQLTEEYPYPPNPLRHYMASDYWVLRDANWSPDFPSSARSAMALYQMGQGITSDGVIALDQQALSYIVRAVEPLTVEEEQVTGDNLIQIMREQWAPEPGQEFNAEWWLQRKSFMLTLAQTLRQKFEGDLGSVNLPVLATSLQQAMAEKHILVYVDDPVWTQFLNKENWTGSLVTTASDYLMIVDANVGFNKASAVVERELIYQVALDEEGGAQAHINLFYQHPAPRIADSCSHEPRYDPVYEQNMSRCYWNYMRVIVPTEAQLVRGPSVIVDGQYLLRGESTTGEIDVELLDSGKIGWGQLFLLAPEEIVSLDYIYTLPAGTARLVGDHWEYSLYLQKQPGTLESSVKVDITLPEGAQLFDAEPLPSSQDGTTFSYPITMDTDQTLKISYKLAKN